MYVIFNPPLYHTCEYKWSKYHRCSILKDYGSTRYRTRVSGTSTEYLAFSMRRPVFWEEIPQPLPDIKTRQKTLPSFCITIYTECILPVYTASILPNTLPNVKESYIIDNFVYFSSTFWNSQIVMKRMKWIQKRWLNMYMYHIHTPSCNIYCFLTLSVSTLEKHVCSCSQN